MQLTDQEIKSDLSQIKELFKVSESIQGNSETNMSEMEVVETVEEMVVEKSEDRESSEEDKIVIKTTRYTNRAKPQRRGGAISRATERTKVSVVQTIVKGKFYSLRKYLTLLRRKGYQQKYQRHQR